MLLNNPDQVDRFVNAALREWAQGGIVTSAGFACLAQGDGAMPTMLLGAGGSGELVLIFVQGVAEAKRKVAEFPEIRT